MRLLRWLWGSEGGLACRVAMGVLVFGAIAMWDIARHGRSGKRWKEYVFLLAMVLLAMAYGVVNDQITVTISWEYFYYGKLMGETGLTVPPEQIDLRLAAVRVGAMGTWWMGLILGSAVLIANNPRPGRPQLPYGRLARLALWPIGAAAALGGVLGVVGWFGWLGGGGVEELAEAGLVRQANWMCVWGVHLGGYLGGAGGAVAAVAAIIRRPRPVRAAAGGIVR